MRWWKRLLPHETVQAIESREWETRRRFEGDRLALVFAARAARLDEMDAVRNRVWKPRADQTRFLVSGNPTYPQTTFAQYSHAHGVRREEAFELVPMAFARDGLRWRWSNIMPADNRSLAPLNVHALVRAIEHECGIDIQKVAPMTFKTFASPEWSLPEAVEE